MLSSTLWLCRARWNRRPQRSFNPHLCVRSSPAAAGALLFNDCCLAIESTSNGRSGQALSLRAGKKAVGRTTLSVAKGSRRTDNSVRRSRDGQDCPSYPMMPNNLRQNVEGAQYYTGELCAPSTFGRSRILRRTPRSIWQRDYTNFAVRTCDGNDRNPNRFCNRRASGEPAFAAGS